MGEEGAQEDSCGKFGILRILMPIDTLPKEKLGEKYLLGSFVNRSNRQSHAPFLCRTNECEPAGRLRTVTLTTSIEGF